MTQQEFEERTGIQPTAGEYDVIEGLYNLSSLNKDEFCKDYKEHSNSEILQELSELLWDREVAQAKRNKLIKDIASALIYKSRAYNDKAFRTMAVELVGEMEVVKLTVALGVKLCEEDKELINNALNRYVD